MATFFTSDTHFGDHRVLNLYPRPFGSLAEMDAELVVRWNARVSPKDEVWHLGDFARTARLAAETLSSLNGTKHLLIGNNDPTPGLEQGWSSVQHYAEVAADGADLILGHYPFRSWNRMHRGSLNLHGHSHGRLAPLTRQFDVGVDVHDFFPVTVAELLASRRRRRTKEAVAS